VKREIPILGKERTLKVAEKQEFMIIFGWWRADNGGNNITLNLIIYMEKTPESNAL
jgi:hypothetical protein